MPKLTEGQHISMARQAYIRLNDELAALRERPSIEVPDDYMDSTEHGDSYRARRARIRHIAELLANASVDDDSTGEGIAEPGTAVTIHYDDTGDIETFVLGGHGAGDADNQIYPLRSPLGRSVAGARPGQRRTLTLPGGVTIGVTLLKVQPPAINASTRHRSPTKTHGRSPSAGSVADHACQAA